MTDGWPCPYRIRSISCRGDALHIQIDMQFIFSSVIVFSFINYLEFSNLFSPMLAEFCLPVYCAFFMSLFFLHRFLYTQWCAKIIADRLFKVLPREVSDTMTILCCYTTKLLYTINRLIIETIAASMSLYKTIILLPWKQLKS